MKKTNSFQKSLTALTVLLIVTSGVSTAFAQTGGGTGNNGGGKKKVPANFSLADFTNYMTKFYDVPSVFPWNDPSLPQYSETPSRPNSDVSLQPVIPTPPPAPDYTCLVLGSDGTTSPTSVNLYNNGSCVIDQPAVPILTPGAMGFNGTACEAADYKIQAYWQGGSGRLVATLPAGGPEATAAVACASLTNLDTGAAFSIANLGGDVAYVCRGGLWRLTRLSCSDAGSICSAQTMPVTLNGITVNLNGPAAKSGTAGPSAACTDFGAVAGYHWVGTGIKTACSGTTWAVISSDCALVADTPPPPPRDVNYPNCTGAGTVYSDPYLKAGLKACLNADQSKYFWIMVDGDPAPMVCGDLNAGC